MISYRQIADIDDLSTSSRPQKASNSVVTRLLRNVLFCISSIALTACQSESPATANNNSPDPQTGAAELTDPLVADLTNDSLLAPAAASLAITSEPGFLNLTWDLIPDLRKASIYKFDTVEGFEVLVAQSNDTTTQSLKLPSRTHQRAWHSEQFRVELCDSNDCVSSARISIAGLVENTVQRVLPSVFVQGERFADNVAINASATLMAVSLPVQGAIDLYLRPATLWVNAQRISLESNTQSSTRSITLGLSASGDTLSALVSDDQGTAELKIIERFGEGWFETTSLELEGTANSIANELNDENTNSLSISEDSNLILISTRNNLFTSSRATTGWTAPSRIQANHFESIRPAFSERFSNEAELKSVSSNHAHTRLFTVHTFDQSLWLSVWEQLPGSSATPIWNKTSAYAINNVDSAKEVSIQSDSSGDRLLLAGWELSNNVEHTPVLWRYQIPPASTLNATANEELSVVDSLRFPFAANDAAVLHFSADDALNNLVLGWQSMESGTSEPDAVLINYQYSPTAMRWLTKLELPEVFPTFAKQSLIRSALLSPDGSAMIISIGAEQFPAGENRVGELLALQ